MQARQPQNPSKEIKGVPMIHAELNGQYEMYLPKHRADRPEWYTKKGWEKKRLESMRKHLGENDTIFYVGSEEGEMPALCQMWGAKVVMFEPNDKVWANTKAIWDANKLTPPLATFSGFASNQTSPKVPLILGGFPESANGPIIHDHGFKELIDPGNIPQVKIDDIVDQHGIIPTAISTDCEGSDWEVLKGAEQTLRKYHPRLWISWHPEHQQRMFGNYIAHSRKWLMDMGYMEVFIDYPLHELHMFYIYAENMTIEEVEAQAKLDSPEEVFIERAHARNLFDSIRREGILEPIVLDKESFVDGQHRFVVAKHLGLKTVPVIQR